MPISVSNPYVSDESDQDHCAECGAVIAQPARGPARIYCDRSECRRRGALRHKLARAWSEGYEAGSRGRPLVPAPSPPDRRHWKTAFEAGAEAAKRHALDKFYDLESAIDFQVRRPTPEHRVGLQRAQAAMRKSLQLGARTAPPPRP